MPDDRIPHILVLVCGWHPATAADNAGDGMHSYGANVRLVSLNCLGRLTPAHILRAFCNGVDGVLVVGCGLGDCHYSNGNERCQPIVDRSRRILQLMGVEGKRLGLHLTSEVDGDLFSRLVCEFDEEIRKLGPLHGVRV